MKRLLILATIALVVVEIGIICSVRAGDANERTLPRLPHSALKPPVLPPITVVGVSAMPPAECRQEAGTVAASSTPPASTHDTPPIITPAVTVGASADALDIDRAWIYRYLESVERDRQHRRMVWRIDTWLSQAGSPMAGTGECFVANSERTGIPAALPVGVAWAESSAGLRCYRNPPGGCSYNAYGMIGPEYRGGFSSWEEGITANFDYLVKHFTCPQSMHDCPGYCEGDTTMQTVDGVQRYIENMDAEWIQ